MSEVLFVGREREKELYKKFLARETPWVLIITGLGGIGKTTLLHRLADYTSSDGIASKTCVIMLDFANEELRNDPLKILDKLANDTVPYCDVQQIDGAFKNEQRQNFDQLAELSKERAQTGASESKDLALREIRHQMRELATEEFYVQIKTFTLDRLVIMLDTCEWLDEPEGIEVGQWILNELVPGIHTRMRQKGRQCSVVMSSRVQPKLDVINGQEQRRLTLPMLGRAEVDQYLEHKGMQDPKLRERVFKITYGHALSVSIIGTICEEQQKQGKTFLSEDDFPALQEVFNERASMKFVNERILQRLNTPYRELTHYGVLLRSFDLPLLQAVFSEWLSEEKALERFDQLIRYPYIESLGNYRYAFHELLREVLAEEFQKEGPGKEKGKFYHKQALDYFKQLSPQSPERYYHAIAYDEKQGMADWTQAIQDARPNQISTLLQVTYDKTLKLTPSSCAVRSYEQGRFDYASVEWLTATGNMQQASTKQGAALKSFKEAVKLFQEAGDSCGTAVAEEAIGALQQPSTVGRTALRSYWQVCQSTTALTKEGRKVSRRDLISLSAAGAVLLLALVSGIGYLELGGKKSSAPNPTPSPSPISLYPKLLVTYRGHTNEVDWVAWSPDGKRIASGSRDWQVHVWDSASGNLLYMYMGHTDWVFSVAWSLNEQRIASSSADSTVQVWDATTGGDVVTYSGHRAAVVGIARSPNGKNIASASVDKTVHVWNIGSGMQIFSYRGHTAEVDAVTWSPDGKRIASGGVDQSVQVWDAANGTQVFTYYGHTARIDTVAWSPDGKYIASGGVDQSVQVWNAINGKLVTYYSGHSARVRAVAWSPDGKYIASASADLTVQVWNAVTGDLIVTYLGHTNWVHAVAWSPDGKYIASASADLTVQVWQP